jgi:hypothetical protein
MADNASPDDGIPPDDGASTAMPAQLPGDTEAGAADESAAATRIQAVHRGRISRRSQVQHQHQHQHQHQQRRQPATISATPKALSSEELAAVLGEVQRDLTGWVERHTALAAAAAGAEEPVDAAARRRWKAEEAAAVRECRELLRTASHAAQRVGPGARPLPAATAALRALTTEAIVGAVPRLVDGGRARLAAQWVEVVGQWLCAVAGAASPLGLACIEAGNELACVCLSSTALSKASVRVAMAAAACAAVQQSLQAIRSIRQLVAQVQEQLVFELQREPPVLARLVASCHLNGCAAEGRRGRHRVALTHARKARKAALSALQADAQAGQPPQHQRRRPAADAQPEAEQPEAEQPEAAAEAAQHSDGWGDGGGGGGGGGAVGGAALELLALAWHAAGAQHESLDEPGACLTAYSKAAALVEKHQLPKELGRSVRAAAGESRRANSSCWHGPAAAAC